MRSEGGVLPGAHPSGVGVAPSGGPAPSSSATSGTSGGRSVLTRVDTLAIKGQLMQSLGPQRGAEYLSLVARFMTSKLSRGEAETRIPALLGPSGIHLHNQLVRGILSNAHCDHQPPPRPHGLPPLHLLSQTASQAAAASRHLAAAGAAAAKRRRLELASSAAADGAGRGNAEPSGFEGWVLEGLEEWEEDEEGEEGDEEEEGEEEGDVGDRRVAGEGEVGSEDEEEGDFGVDGPLILGSFTQGTQDLRKTPSGAPVPRKPQASIPGAAPSVGGRMAWKPGQAGRPKHAGGAEEAEEEEGLGLEDEDEEMMDEEDDGDRGLTSPEDRALGAAYRGLHRENSAEGVLPVRPAGVAAPSPRRQRSQSHGSRDRAKGVGKGPGSFSLHSEASHSPEDTQPGKSTSPAAPTPGAAGAAALAGAGAGAGRGGKLGTPRAGSGGLAPGEGTGEAAARGDGESMEEESEDGFIGQLLDARGGTGGAPGPGAPGLGNGVHTGKAAGAGADKGGARLGAGAAPYPGVKKMKREAEGVPKAKGREAGGAQAKRQLSGDLGQQQQPQQPQSYGLGKPGGVPDALGMQEVQERSLAVPSLLGASARGYAGGLFGGEEEEEGDEEEEDDEEDEESVLSLSGLPLKALQAKGMPGAASAAPIGTNKRGRKDGTRKARDDGPDASGQRQLSHQQLSQLKEKREAQQEGSQQLKQTPLQQQQLQRQQQQAGRQQDQKGPQGNQRQQQQQAGSGQQNQRKPPQQQQQQDTQQLAQQGPKGLAKELNEQQQQEGSGKQQQQLWLLHQLSVLQQQQQHQPLTPAQQQQHALLLHQVEQLQADEAQAKQQRQQHLQRQPGSAEQRQKTGPYAPPGSVFRGTPSDSDPARETDPRVSIKSESFPRGVPSLQGLDSPRDPREWGGALGDGSGLDGEAAREREELRRVRPEEAAAQEQDRQGQRRHWAQWSVLPCQAPLGVPFCRPSPGAAMPLPLPKTPHGLLLTHTLLGDPLLPGGARGSRRRTSKSSQGPPTKSASQASAGTGGLKAEPGVHQPGTPGARAQGPTLPGSGAPGVGTGAPLAASAAGALASLESLQVRVRQQACQDFGLQGVAPQAVELLHKAVALRLSQLLEASVAAVHLRRRLQEGKGSRFPAELPSSMPAPEPSPVLDSAVTISMDATVGGVTMAASQSQQPGGKGKPQPQNPGFQKPQQRRPQQQGGGGGQAAAGAAKQLPQLGKRVEQGARGLDQDPASELYPLGRAVGAPAAKGESISREPQPDASQASGAPRVDTLDKQAQGGCSEDAALAALRPNAALASQPADGVPGAVKAGQDQEGALLGAGDGQEAMTAGEDVPGAGPIVQATAQGPGGALEGPAGMQGTTTEPSPGAPGEPVSGVPGAPAAQPGPGGESVAEGPEAAVEGEGLGEGKKAAGGDERAGKVRSEMEHGDDAEGHKAAAAEPQGAAGGQARDPAPEAGAPGPKAVVEASAGPGALGGPPETEGTEGHKGAGEGATTTAGQDGAGTEPGGEEASEVGNGSLPSPASLAQPEAGADAEEQEAKEGEGEAEGGAQEGAASEVPETAERSERAGLEEDHAAEAVEATATRGGEARADSEQAGEAGGIPGADPMELDVQGEGDGAQREPGTGEHGTAAEVVETEAMDVDSTEAQLAEGQVQSEAERVAQQQATEGILKGQRKDEVGPEDEGRAEAKAEGKAEGETPVAGPDPSSPVAEKEGTSTEPAAAARDEEAEQGVVGEVGAKDGGQEVEGGNQDLPAAEAREGESTRPQGSQEGREDTEAGTGADETKDGKAEDTEAGTGADETKDGKAEEEAGGKEEEKEEAPKTEPSHVAEGTSASVAVPREQEEAACVAGEAPSGAGAGTGEAGGAPREAQGQEDAEGPIDAGAGAGLPTEAGPVAGAEIGDEEPKLGEAAGQKPAEDDKAKVPLTGKAEVGPGESAHGSVKEPRGGGSQGSEAQATCTEGAEGPESGAGSQEDQGLKEAEGPQEAKGPQEAEDAQEPEDPQESEVPKEAEGPEGGTPDKPQDAGHAGPGAVAQATAEDGSSQEAVGSARQQQPMGEQAVATSDDPQGTGEGGEGRKGEGALGSASKPSGEEAVVIGEDSTSAPKELAGDAGTPMELDGTPAEHKGASGAQEEVAGVGDMGGEQPAGGKETSEQPLSGEEQAAGTDSGGLNAGGVLGEAAPGVHVGGEGEVKGSGAQGGGAVAGGANGGHAAEAPTEEAVDVKGEGEGGEAAMEGLREEDGVGIDNLPKEQQGSGQGQQGAEQVLAEEASKADSAVHAQVAEEVAAADAQGEEEGGSREPGTQKPQVGPEAPGGLAPLCDGKTPQATSSPSPLAASQGSGPLAPAKDTGSQDVAPAKDKSQGLAPSGDSTQGVAPMEQDSQASGTPPPGALAADSGESQKGVAQEGKAEGGASERGHPQASSPKTEPGAVSGKVGLTSAVPQAEATGHATTGTALQAQSQADRGSVAAPGLAKASTGSAHSTAPAPAGAQQQSASLGTEGGKGRDAPAPSAAGVQQQDKNCAYGAQAPPGVPAAGEPSQGVPAAGEPSQGVPAAGAKSKVPPLGSEAGPKREGAPPVISALDLLLAFETQPHLLASDAALHLERLSLLLH